MYGDESGYMFVLTIALIGGTIYLIPTIVAFLRGHPNRWLIMVINVAFGGTVIGWLGPLVWAMSAVHRSPTGNHGGESGVNLFVNDEVRLAIPPPAPDPGDQLLRLKKLLDDGVLSQDEYHASRKPWLEALTGRRV